MGVPWVELQRDTIRHACGVTHVVSLTKPTATFHPRPIAGSGFYATVLDSPYWLRNCIKEELKALRDAQLDNGFTNNEQRTTSNLHE
ncbi:hypothetical protein [Tenuifilum osseticum]|uniref:hypothetical protein n=1 Tax=Tenuifilum osseticum TaxID=3374723 RepID=UPI0034E537AB